MKKIILVIGCFIAFTCTCFAQDVIVTKDSREISVKVTEVNEDNIKYKNFDHQDGPTYMMQKSDVSSIIYQNGKVETFDPATSVQITKHLSLTHETTGDLVFEMQIIDEKLYRQYQNSKRLSTIGYTLMGTGAVLSIVGGTLGYGGVKGFEDISVGAFYSGGVCFLAGIPCLTIGLVKQNGYSQKHSLQIKQRTQRTGAHLNLNLNNNGIGLACVF